MRLAHFISGLVFVASMVGAHEASALSVDDKSMNGGNASSFDDPDDKTPTPIFSPPGGSRSYMKRNKEGSSSGAVDPNTVNYEYDPSSGNYYPHK